VRLVARYPSDEIYRISCKDEIRACRDEAARACNGVYQVLESTGAPIEPPRVTSAPGPATTGPRYQRTQWVGQMVVACGDATPPLESPSVDRAPAPAPAVTPQPPERLCIPGVTQECLGPAACRGAQACLPDGNGYGPCDCGEQQTPERGTNDASPSRVPEQ
jgi:hypothetical protein